FSGKRIPGAAEVPTLSEAGGPPLESSTWVLFMAPGGTRREIVNRLAQETARAINESDIMERFNQIGIEPVGGTPEHAATFLDAEIGKWAKVINTAGVKAGAHHARRHHAEPAGRQSGRTFQRRERPHRLRKSEP